MSQKCQSAHHRVGAEQNGFRHGQATGCILNGTISACVSPRYASFGTNELGLIQFRSLAMKRREFISLVGGLAA